MDRPQNRPIPTGGAVARTPRLYDQDPRSKRYAFDPYDSSLGNGSPRRQHRPGGVRRPYGVLSLGLEFDRAQKDREFRAPRFARSRERKIAGFGRFTLQFAR